MITFNTKRNEKNEILKWNEKKMMEFQTNLPDKKQKSHWDRIDIGDRVS